MVPGRSKGRVWRSVTQALWKQLVYRGNGWPAQEAARRCSCVDIILAPRPRLKLEGMPMRPPQASQIDTMLPSALALLA